MAPRKDIEDEGEPGPQLALQRQIQVVPPAPKLPFKLPPLFGKYPLDEVVVSDKGLARYINLNPIISAHSEARGANKLFGKGRINLVERIVNNLMRTEHFTGKKSKGLRVVKEAFDYIATKTHANPVQVLVSAVENAAPREEITRLQFGGISVPKAVDISPCRRLDVAIRHICKGAMSASHKSVKPIHLCLADEILAAANKDMNSYSISKKEESERIAASAW